MSFPVPSISAIPIKIGPISTHLPARVLTNAELGVVFETWTADKIYEKTGIATRHIAGADETALDLGVFAAKKLFAKYAIETNSIDFLIFCTQAPDFLLPSSACIMQDRLGLEKSTGALDITLGCSGFVYGLSLAAGLIAGGMADRVLLVTADTYSKFINPLDRSVRTLFGDGAAATIIDRAPDGDTATIGCFVFGTDGKGSHDLIVKTGGARQPKSHETAIEEIDDFGNTRSADNLFMNGTAVLSFSLREIPRTYKKITEKAGLTDDEIDFVVMHQANRFMIDALRKKMKLPVEKVPCHFEKIGNTVSSSIPFVLEEMARTGQLTQGMQLVLLGFGVGLSWAGCIVTI